MTCICPVITLSPRDYDAVLFDLDGVLTRTASVHAAAWKKLFDGFLERRSAETGEPFVPFDIDTDYRRYVDGKPRYDGVTDFLKSRGIELPLGAPEDGADAQSVHALGSRKDGYFLQHLEQHGVETYEAVDRAGAQTPGAGNQDRGRVLQQQLRGGARGCGYRGVCSTRGWTGWTLPVSNSRASRQPDAFLEAAQRLEAEPSRAVVVEDAIAGVEAGRAGRFGCVIGVDRSGHAQALREAGADVVVTSLAQVQVASGAPFRVVAGVRGLRSGARKVSAKLCAPWGMATSRRVAPPPEAVADDIHYPGTYLAGGYNRLRTDIAGQRGRERGSRQFPQLARARVSHRRRGLVRCANRQAPVVPSGTRSAARHAVADHALRGRPRAAQYARGATPGLDGRHASGRAGTGADRRELVRQRHGTFGDRRARRQRGREAVPQVQQPAPGAAGERGRRRGRHVLCWCAPASRIFMSRRRRERERSSTDGRSMFGAE